MIPRIQTMVELLEEHSDDPGLIANLDLTEYRRHKTELLALQAELQETLERLLTINTRIEDCYPVIFQHWRNDLIRLNTYRSLMNATRQAGSEDLTVSRPL